MQKKAINRKAFTFSKCDFFIRRFIIWLSQQHKRYNLLKDWFSAFVFFGEFKINNSINSLQISFTFYR
jgi:hypothetical protein